MYYFCDTTDGDVVAWSLKDAPSGCRVEYPIYLRVRPLDFILLADNFVDFILHVCLGGGFDRRLQESGYVVEDPSEVQRVFIPVVVPKQGKRRASTR
jgi:hypothetical protein